MTRQTGQCYKCQEVKEVRLCGRSWLCINCEPRRQYKKNTPTYYEELLAKQEGMTIEQARKWLRKYRNPFSLH